MTCDLRHPVGLRYPVDNCRQECKKQEQTRVRKSLGGYSLEQTQITLQCRQVYSLEQTRVDKGLQESTNEQTRSLLDFSLEQTRLLLSVDNSTLSNRQEYTREDKGMGWLRLVGSIKVWVSFVEYSLFYRALLQNRPYISRSILIVSTPQTSVDGTHPARADVRALVMAVRMACVVTRLVLGIGSLVTGLMAPCVSNQSFMCWRSQLQPAAHVKLLSADCMRCVSQQDAGTHDRQHQHKVRQQTTDNRARR